jgi:hypothetical protein
MLHARIHYEHSMGLMLPDSGILLITCCSGTGRFNGLSLLFFYLVLSEAELGERNAFC